MNISLYKLLYPTFAYYDVGGVSVNVGVDLESWTKEGHNVRTTRDYGTVEWHRATTEARRYTKR